VSRFRATKIITALAGFWAGLLVGSPALAAVILQSDDRFVSVSMTGVDQNLLAGGGSGVISGGGVAVPIPPFSDFDQERSTSHDPDHRWLAEQDSIIFGSTIFAEGSVDTRNEAEPGITADGSALSRVELEFVITEALRAHLSLDSTAFLAAAGGLFSLERDGAIVDDGLYDGLVPDALDREWERDLLPGVYTLIVEARAEGTGFAAYSLNLGFSEVPEPGVLVLTALGLVALAGRRRS
jgi:hypothetical protein